MAKDMRTDVERLRAADSDRQKVAEQLKAALDEGGSRSGVRRPRARCVRAKTYQSCSVSHRPAQPGLSAAEVAARRRRRPRARPAAADRLLVLWTIWAALTVVNLVVFGLVAATVSGDLYPWPVWMLVPGAALGAVTVGVQAIRTSNGRVKVEGDRLHPCPLSVLDLATVREGHTSADALRGTIEIAKAADDLGYSRFWVAEHHNMPAVASTSPPVLIASVAAHTAASGSAPAA
jgi:hypothetical protein